MQNPLRSEGDAFRFLLGTVVYFALIAIAGVINAWAGLVVFIALSVAVVWWWWRSREPRAPVQASPVRKEFKPLSRVNPTFPRQALQQGITGRVVAWVYVAPNGSVSNVEIKSSSNRLFDREVVRALSQWRFNPEPVGFIGEYEIVFNLTD